jgi:RNA polymerase subunit RPABC4/transcription elongation factor Spt4
MDDRKMKECPSCAMETDSKAEVCPVCGYEFPRQSRMVVIMAWIMILLAILWLVF